MRTKRVSIGFTISVAVVVASAPAGTAQCETTELTASDASTGDLFGSSIALDDRYVVIGAAGDEINGEERGSAYVFERAPAGWFEAAKLTASDGAHDDHLGSAVAISGTRALIGAPDRDEVDVRSGAVYVFERGANGWTQTAKLVPSDPSLQAQFGFSVALEGGTAIIGALGDDSWTGAAYVFELQGATWIQTAKLVASDPVGNAFFGTSVALQGGRAVVGATGASGVLPSAGAAYVFEQQGASWLETAKLTAADGSYSDYFGVSVSMDGDRVLIGQQAGDAGDFEGSAYVFDFVHPSWQESAKLVSSDLQPFDWFGYSVALAGDTALVGAFFHTAAGALSGAVYVFERQGGVWLETNELTGSDTEAYDSFGRALAASENTAMIGAWGGGGVIRDSGSVYSFQLEPFAAVYCTPKTNSCGTLPTLTFSGTPSASSSSGFVVGVQNSKATKPGLLIYTNGGSANVPFQGGTLCVSPPIRRSHVLVDTAGNPPNCDGMLSIDLNAFASGNLGGNPAPFLREPGQQVNGQFWGRDTPGNSLLSDAIEYIVCR